MRHAEQDELTDGVEHEYVIYYPSAGAFKLTGILGTIGFPSGLVHYIRSGEEMYLLDERAVVVRDRLIILDPRRRDPTSLNPPIRDWLTEHPEWPRIVTENLQDR